MALHNEGDWRMETWQRARQGELSCLHTPIPELCNAILNPCQMPSRFYIIPSNVNKSQTHLLKPFLACDLKLRSHIRGADAERTRSGSAISWGQWWFGARGFKADATNWVLDPFLAERILLPLRLHSATAHVWTHVMICVEANFQPASARVPPRMCERTFMEGHICRQNTLMFALVFCFELRARAARTCCHCHLAVKNPIHDGKRGQLKLPKK